MRDEQPRLRPEPFSSVPLLLSISPSLWESEEKTGACGFSHYGRRTATPIACIRCLVSWIVKVPK